MKIQSAQGFTLVEVIMGMFILSLILIGLNGALVSYVKTNQRTKSVAEATSVGNKVLERYRMITYTLITSNSGHVGTSFFQTSLVTADSLNRKKEIEVVVSWPDSAAAHAVRMKTIIAKP